jgi:hypothetical protein
VQRRELLHLLSGWNGLNDSEIDSVLDELPFAIVHNGLSGRGVTLKELGTYLPVIKLDGTIGLFHRLDPEIRHALNRPRDFTGEIGNRVNIGKSLEELVDQWNSQYPNDPITI